MRPPVSGVCARKCPTLSLVPACIWGDGSSPNSIKSSQEQGRNNFLRNQTQTPMRKTLISRKSVSCSPQHSLLQENVCEVLLHRTRCVCAFVGVCPPPLKSWNLSEAPAV